jgi:uncharacterized membrane protein YeaQ/YmgE (transglycosylase-associated protein family)
MVRADHATGVIRNKRDATVWVILTAVIGALARHSTFQPVRLTSPWIFESLYGLSRLGRPVLIGLSVFFWVFVLWILFWLYRAMRGRYERLLVGSFAAGFILSVIKRFMSPQFAADLQFLDAAEMLVSFVAAMALLFTLPPKTTAPR